MSNKQETIADIVAEMRLVVKDWKGERLGVFDCFADRIAAAAKREREAGAEAAQICGEIGEMIGMEATREKSSRVGNAAKRKNEVTDRNIYIVYDGVRYRLVEGRDCTNHCSFRKADGPDYCERGCYLPSWFKRLCIGGNYWLERVDQKVEPIKKVKGGAK